MQQSNIDGGRLVGASQDGAETNSLAQEGW